MPTIFLNPPASLSKKFERSSGDSKLFKFKVEIVNPRKLFIPSRWILEIFDFKNSKKHYKTIFFRQNFLKMISLIIHFHYITYKSFISVKRVFAQKTAVNALKNSINEILIMNGWQKIFRTKIRETQKKIIIRFVFSRIFVEPFGREFNAV